MSDKILYLTQEKKMTKKLILSILGLFCTWILLQTSFAGSINITWDPVNDSDLAGYRLYYGIQSRIYNPHIQIDKSITNYQVENLKDGTYYIAVTAIDTSVNESGFSNEEIKIIKTNTDSFFSDDFTNDTTDNYNVFNTWTSGGTGKFSFDNTNKRAVVLTGNDIGLKFSHNLEPLENGNFSFDFYPEKYYPNGGIIILRLIQDSNNYYELKNSDGYGPGYILKIINGKEVERTAFKNEFSQGKNYKIDISFSPDSTIVHAFGEQTELKGSNLNIMVNSFEIETIQQDASYDNFIYNQLLK